MILFPKHIFDKIYSRFQVITSSFAAIIDTEKGNRPGYVYSEKDWNPMTKEAALENPSRGYFGSKTFAEKAAWDFVEKEKPNFTLATVNTYPSPFIPIPSVNSIFTLSATPQWCTVPYPIVSPACPLSTLPTKSSATLCKANSRPASPQAESSSGLMSAILPSRTPELRKCPKQAGNGFSLPLAIIAIVKSQMQSKKRIQIWRIRYPETMSRVILILIVSSRFLSPYVVFFFYLNNSLMLRKGALLIVLIRYL